MKKLLTNLILTTLLILNMSPLAHAQVKLEDVFNPGKITNVQSTDSKGANAATDPRVTENLSYVKTLPNDDHRNVISEIVKKILFVSGVLTTVAVIVAAVFYMISMGNEDQMTKAKNILLYTIIGLVIISTAYGLVVGLAKIEIF